MEYFRSRGGVIFLGSDPMFEEQHHSHQNLGLVLARYGIPVLWFDGYGWSRKAVVIPAHASGPLTVRPLPVLPGRRLNLIEQLNGYFQSWYVKREMRKFGGNPVVWVHSRLLEPLVEHLPYVDVFSYFDDLYHHLPGSVLPSRARLLVTQNRYGAKVINLPSKTLSLFPPRAFDETEIPNAQAVALPEGFPKQRIGYVGSLYDRYIDYDALEELIIQMPDWGFVFVGRSDKATAIRLEALTRHRNFLHFPFVPRREVAKYWSLIDVCLLLYIKKREQDGAFASKALEALYFGASLCGFIDHKIDFLANDFPFVNERRDLKQAILTAHRIPNSTRERVLRSLLKQMHPKYYLGEVAKFLSK